MRNLGLQPQYGSSQGIEAYSFSTPRRFRRAETSARSSIPCRKACRCFSQPDHNKNRLLGRFLLWSGCRESNPDLMLPKQVYYHYTTARILSFYNNARKKCIQASILSLQELYTFWVSWKKPQKVLRSGPIRKWVPNSQSSHHTTARIWTLP